MADLMMYDGRESFHILNYFSHDSRRTSHPFTIHYFCTMRKIFIALLGILMACNDDNKDAIPISENDVDAARNFINAALDGHYDDARSLVLSDSANNAWIDLFKRNYQSRMTMADKAGYRDASINIHSVAQPNDSTTIVHYSNSYKKRTDSLKVVRHRNAWLVDLKYSFTRQNTNDSLP